MPHSRREHRSERRRRGHERQRRPVRSHAESRKAISRHTSSPATTASAKLRAVSRTIVDAGRVALPAQATTTSITGVVTGFETVRPSAEHCRVLGGASLDRHRRRVCAHRTDRQTSICALPDRVPIAAHQPAGCRGRAMSFSIFALFAGAGRSPSAIERQPGERGGQRRRQFASTVDHQSRLVERRRGVKLQVIDLTAPRHGPARS